MSIPIPKVAVSRFVFIALAALLFSGLIASSARAEIESTESCAAPVLTQHFLTAGDSNWYTQAPGQDESGFTGAGWKLTGGAKVEATTGANGQIRNVLVLPSGSKAVSPTVCVTREYPRARMGVRNVLGSEGVFFYVSYANTNTWNSPKNTGQVHGSGKAWTLSDPVNLQPPGVSGWQLVKFTLIPGGKASLFQVDDFYVDPFCRH